MSHTRIIVTHDGGPDELRVVEEESPEPKDGEVRVRVLAAGVTYPDLLRRSSREALVALYAGLGSDWRGGSAGQGCLWNRARPDNCRAADKRCIRGVRLPAPT